MNAITITLVTAGYVLACKIYLLSLEFACMDRVTSMSCIFTFSPSLLHHVLRDRVLRFIAARDAAGRNVSLFGDSVCDVSDNSTRSERGLMPNYVEADRYSKPNVVSGRTH